MIPGSDDADVIVPDKAAVTAGGTVPGRLAVAPLAAGTLRRTGRDGA